MTKKKTAPFKGDWLQSWITAPPPLWGGLSDERRDKILQERETAENEARRGLLRIIANDQARRKYGGQSNGITRAAVLRSMDDPRLFAVAFVVLEQMAAWRFDQTHREQDPEPAQWAGLIRSIEVPETPELPLILKLSRDIEGLPVDVLAELDLQLFRAEQIGRVALIQRLRQSPAPRDLALLRDTLGDMAEAAKYVKGKRGTKRDIAPHLQAVCAALIARCDYTLPAARPVAAELLRAVRIPAPKSRSQLSALAPK